MPKDRIRRQQAIRKRQQWRNSRGGGQFPLKLARKSISTHREKRGVVKREKEVERETRERRERKKEKEGKRRNQRRKRKERKRGKERKNVLPRRNYLTGKKWAVSPLQPTCVTRPVGEGWGAGCDAAPPQGKKIKSKKVHII